MADMCEREKIAKKIEKTSESIKKHRALKTDRIEDIALDRYFKPIIKPLWQIVHNSGVRVIKRELYYNDAASVTKHEKKEEKQEEKDKEDNVTFELSATLRKFDDRSHSW